MEKWGIGMQPSKQLGQSSSMGEGEWAFRQAGLKGWGERGRGEQIYSGVLRVLSRAETSGPQSRPLPVSHGECVNTALQVSHLPSSFFFLRAEDRGH